MRVTDAVKETTIVFFTAQLSSSLKNCITFVTRHYNYGVEKNYGNFCQLSVKSNVSTSTHRTNVSFSLSSQPLFGWLDVG